MGGFWGFLGFPGKPTGNLLPSLLGGYPPRMAIPLGYHFPGAPNPIVPECTLWSSSPLHTYTSSLQRKTSTLSVRPPTAGPKKHLYPFSGALYLCPLKYHLGRDSPTNPKKPSVLPLKTSKNDPPRGGQNTPKIRSKFLEHFWPTIKRTGFRKTQNPEYTNIYRY